MQTRIRLKVEKKKIDFRRILHTSILSPRAFVSLIASVSNERFDSIQVAIKGESMKQRQMYLEQRKVGVFIQTFQPRLISFPDEIGAKI